MTAHAPRNLSATECRRSLSHLPDASKKFAGSMQAFPGLYELPNYLRYMSRLRYLPQGNIAFPFSQSWYTSCTMS